MPEIYPNVLEPTERITDKLKRSAGRIAIRATAIIAGAGTIFTGIVAAESATSHEAVAEAYHITSAEKAWCRWPSRWGLCTQAQSMADAAEHEAARIAAQSGWSNADGGADAVRHCTWNGLMAANFGRSTAAGFGNRHEYDDTQSSQQLEMDLHNNMKGRDWAIIDLDQMVDRCVEGVESGELIRLTN